MALRRGRSSGAVVVVGEGETARALAARFAGGERSVCLYLTAEAEEGVSPPPVPGVRNLDVLEEMPDDTAFIVDALFADLDDKFDMLKALDEHRPEHACIVSLCTVVEPSDACLDLDAPEAFVGFSLLDVPAAGGAAEIVTHARVERDVVKRAAELFAAAGFAVVIVRDLPVAARVIAVAINEAAGLVDRGAFSVRELDEALADRWGMATGPLEYADRVGLDHVLGVLENLHHVTKQPAYAPSPGLRRLVLAGWFGKDAGSGFYDWPENGRGPVAPTTPFKAGR